MTKAYFLSDIHIKKPEESNSEKLLLFLHQLENTQDAVSHLFLGGDIFDLWIHNHVYFVDKYVKIVNAIRALVAKGIEVHYFEGNHDLYLTRFWQQDVGVRVHDGPVYFNLGSKIVRVEHGDFMNPEDKGYLFLRKVLRSLPVSQIAKNLPGRAVQWIGDRASQASRHYTSHQKKMEEESVKEFMHNYAEQAVKERFFDYLISGHTHVRDEYVFSHDGEEVISINLGSWFEEQKVLCLTNEGHQFINL